MNFAAGVIHGSMHRSAALRSGPQPGAPPDATSCHPSLQVASSKHLLLVWKHVTGAQMQLAQVAPCVLGI